MLGKRQSQRNTLILAFHNHTARRLFLTVSLLVGLLTTAAQSQGDVPAHPSRQTRQQIAVLLDAALPLFDIAPEQLPGRFRRQVIKRIYEHAILYRADMQAMLHRATPLLPMIEEILEQHDLPPYFAYLPMVESAFRTDAAHPGSGASGLWQLMPATARGFGLRVTPHVDERLNPKRATVAAARYLQYLYERFGPRAPLHILAAYNHGDTNLVRTMQRSRTDDIWTLYRTRRLPYETRAYLIRMVAMWTVIAHASHFDLVLETPDPLPATALADTDRPWPFSLVQIADPILRHRGQEGKR
jgi:soluble lytic murein transglycosylase-like protein